MRSPFRSPNLALVAAIAAASSGCLGSPARPAGVAEAGIRLTGTLQPAAGRQLQAFAGWRAQDVASWKATLLEGAETVRTRTVSGPLEAGSQLDLGNLRPDRTYKVRIDAYVAGREASIADPAGSTTSIDTGPDAAGGYPLALDQPFVVRLADRPFPGRQPVTVAVAGAAFPSTRVRVEVKRAGETRFGTLLDQALPGTGGTVAVEKLHVGDTYKLIAEGLDPNGRLIISDAKEVTPAAGQASADGELAAIALSIGNATPTPTPTATPTPFNPTFPIPTFTPFNPIVTIPTFTPFPIPTFTPTPTPTPTATPTPVPTPTPTPTPPNAFGLKRTAGSATVTVVSPTEIDVALPANDRSVFVLKDLPDVSVTGGRMKFVLPEGKLPAGLRLIATYAQKTQGLETGVIENTNASAVELTFKGGSSYDLRYTSTATRWVSRLNQTDFGGFRTFDVLRATNKSLAFGAKFGNTSNSFTSANANASYDGNGQMGFALILQNTTGSPITATLSTLERTGELIPPGY